MDSILLRNLISSSESSTLEFKREFYDLNSIDQVANKRLKDEMIHDILALANGSISTVGETAYLIIGVEEKNNDERIVTGIEKNPPSSEDLLKIIKAACTPPLPDLHVDSMTIEGKIVCVITIPFSPYLHETTRKLQTPKTQYSPHVVFIRRNSEIDLANGKERKAIEELKRIRFQERNNAPPVLLGALVGGILLSILLGENVDKLSDFQGPAIIGWVSGAIAGVIMGGSLGFTIKEISKIQRDIKLFLIKRK
jgi:predicted HTH transcriptional regulator